MSMHRLMDTLNKKHKHHNVSFWRICQEFMTIHSKGKIFLLQWKKISKWLFKRIACLIKAELRARLVGPLSAYNTMF